MTELDTVVEALEEQISASGVLSLDLPKFVRTQDAFLAAVSSEQNRILVEILRVWMEHRWLANAPVTADDCLAAFPEVLFDETDRENLRFEEQRQRDQRRSLSTASSSSSRSIDELPSLGVVWEGFELLDVLGEGAFAKVYLAKQSGLAERLVALKLTFRKTNESQWLAKLQHSAIVPIYSVHENHGVYGICMPYLGNTTLADLMRDLPQSSRRSKSSWWRRTRKRQTGGGKTMLSTIQQRHDMIETAVHRSTTSTSSSTDSMVMEDSNEPVSTHSSSWTANQLLGQYDFVEAVVWIGVQLSEALAYAHRNGVLHSDIKPANVLLGSDGQPRLLDFNVSYEAENGHFAAPIGGTLAYMAPEHQRAIREPGSIDPRSDLYSLGVLLFQLLTGKLPKTSPKAAIDRATIAANPHQVEELLRLNPAVSPALSAIIRKCLHFHPEERYANAEQLLDDLDAQLRHLPLVHLSEPSILERIQKWSSRHPRITSSLTMAILAVSMLIGLSTAYWVRGAALANSEWKNRMELIRQRLPNAMAQLTAMDALPELAVAAEKSMHEMVGLLSQDEKSSSLDARWGDLSIGPDEELRSAAQDYLWFASQHAWKNEPRLLQELSDSDKFGESEQRKLLQWVREGHAKEAIARLEVRVDENPQDYFSWWLLGDCRAAVQDYSAAQQAYTACVALQPKIALAYFNRAMARYQSSQWVGTIEDYSKCIALEPNWYWARFNRATVYSRMGKSEEALRDLDFALEQGYSTVSVFRLRAELHAMLKDYSAMQADLQQALKCEPTLESHWIDRGLIRLSQKDAEGACDDFQKALLANPRSIAAHQKLAHVYAEWLDQPEKSREHLDRLVELDVLNPTHRAARAVVLAREGNRAEAKNDLEYLQQIPLPEAIVRYQVACAYSLISSGAKSTQDKIAGDSKLEEEMNRALTWFAQAASQDLSILEIARQDPDLEALRSIQEFEEIVRALELIQRTQQPVDHRP